MRGRDRERARPAGTAPARAGWSRGTRPVTPRAPRPRSIARGSYPLNRVATAGDKSLVSFIRIYTVKCLIKEKKVKVYVSLCLHIGYAFLEDLQVGLDKNLWSNTANIYGLFFVSSLTNYEEVLGLKSDD